MPELHEIQPIVTPDRFEYGAHRMRVPGGWIYWLQPTGGALVSAFVPDADADAADAAIKPGAVIQRGATSPADTGTAPDGEGGEAAATGENGPGSSPDSANVPADAQPQA